MDNYLDNRQKEIFWEVLASPADSAASYAPSLGRLVQDNPQSSLLQALLARNGDSVQVSRAAIYGNPRTLHKILNHPADLPAVDLSNIVYADSNLSAQNFFNAALSVAERAENNDALSDADAFDNNGYDFLPPLPTVNQEEVQVPEEVSDAPVAEHDQLEVIEPAATDEQATDEFNRVSAAQTIGDDELPPISHDNEDMPPPIPVEQLELPEAATTAITDDLPITAETAQPDVVQNDAAKEVETHLPPPVTEQVNQFRSRFPKPDVQQSPAVNEPDSQAQDIEDEVYDEIVSIDDIGFAQVTNETQPAAETYTEARFSDPSAQEDTIEDEPESEVLFHQPQPVVEAVQNEEHKQTREEEERLIIGGIVNTDYLSFDKKLDELRASAPVQPEQPKAEGTAAETHEVSRYDDDKMPYTFLWWLNKTRKEHAGNLQPYAKAPVNAGAANSEANMQAKLNKGDELQQQYFENIFSLTSVSGIERDTDPGRVEFDPGKKEDVIIERFIHTEPQIKPLSADKLDNENKAKKSSEDQNDFVTETLARIYTDQMLYHKAIATYKKLMLKFPEKNLYFAARIEELEKKTN